MTPVYILIAIIGLGLLGYIAWKASQKQEGTDDQRTLLQENARINAELDQKLIELGELKAQLGTALKDKDELSGKGKQLYDSFKNLESDMKTLRHERDTLQEELQEWKANDRRRENEFNDRLEKLEGTKVALDQERQRVIHEDEERTRQQLEERDRLWADHENGVIATLTDLCKQPQFMFTSYSNTNLPEGFDGSLKPDFMIDFLDQYVIFDAKVSKAKSLQTYVNDQVKKTVEKVKGNDRIYKWIFLVVPASALSELKVHHYPVEGYQLFVISPEAIPAVLASLKNITRYEFAEQMDPQQRENIIQTIAELDFHINLRNATDIVLSKMGIDILQKTQRMDPAIAEEVAIKKQPMNAKASIAASEIKKIVSDLTAQNMETQRLVSPAAPIKKQSLDDAGSLLADTLL